MTNINYLAEALSEMLCDLDDNIYTDVQDAIDDIETKDRDGFTAYTSGGKEICHSAIVRFDGFDYPAPIQKIADNCYNNAYSDLCDQWIKDNPDLGSLNYCIAQDNDAAIAFRNRFDNEYDESSVYFWKAAIIMRRKGDIGYDAEHANGAETYVSVEAYLNIDLEYGRDYVSWLSHYGGTPDQTRGSNPHYFSHDDFIALTEIDMDALVKSIEMDMIQVYNGGKGQ